MNPPDTHRPDGEHADAQFGRRARQLYQEASHRIDPATAGRLRAARRQALAAARQPRYRAARWLVPTGAFAVIALATLMIWQPASHRSIAPAIQAGANDNADADNDLPPDADRTDPNLYQNLDFYDWLAANNSQPTAH
jgi:hypothetical protein